MAYTYEQLRAFVVEAVDCGCCPVNDVVVDKVVRYVMLNYEAAERQINPANISTASLAELYEFGKFMAAT